MTISPGRRHMATKTCSIKRVALNAATGKTGTAQPVDGLTYIPCTPLVTLSARALERYRTQHGLDAQATVWELYVFDLYDIRKGDILSIDAKEYPISDVVPWKVRFPFITITVEEIMAAPEPNVFVR